MQSRARAIRTTVESLGSRSPRSRREISVRCSWHANASSCCERPRRRRARRRLSANCPLGVVTVSDMPSSHCLVRTSRRGAALAPSFPAAPRPHLRIPARGLRLGQVGLRALQASDKRQGRLGDGFLIRLRRPVICRRLTAKRRRPAGRLARPLRHTTAPLIPPLSPASLRTHNRVRPVHEQLATNNHGRSALDKKPADPGQQRQASGV